MKNSPTNEIRWIYKAVPIDENLATFKNVLQQKWLDGWENPYWKDVEVVTEDEANHNI